MRLYVEVFLYLVYGLGYGAVAALLLQTLEAGQYPPYKQSLLFLNGLNIRIVLVSDFLQLSLLAVLLLKPVVDLEYCNEYCGD